MLLFPNGSCIEENHRTSLHRFRDAEVLYMLYITLYVMYQMWNHSKIIFLKKYIKKRQVYASKEGLQKKLLHKIILIWQYKIKSQQNYFCTKEMTNLSALQK